MQNPHQRRVEVALGHARLTHTPQAPAYAKMQVYHSSFVKTGLGNVGGVLSGYVSHICQISMVRLWVRRSMQASAMLERIVPSDHAAYAALHSAF